MSFPPIVHELAERLESELVGILSERPMPLYRMMTYHLGWSDERGQPLAPEERGRVQRVHGILCLLACRLAGGETESALPAAAAVELVHNFAQIHDDVQSGAPTRGGRNAVWWVWGPAQAINAGDGMHALARLALFRLLQRGIPAERTFQATKLLDQATLDLCEGRFMDLEAQERLDMTVEVYSRMAQKKAGALAACAMRLGALTTSGDSEAQEAMWACGAKLGMAMQVRADLRELWGNGSQGGMPGHEILNKKKVLPVVYALEKASISEKRQLGEIYFKRVLGVEDVGKLRRLMDSLGVREYCEAQVERYRKEALAALDALRVHPSALTEVRQYVDALVKA